MFAAVLYNTPQVLQNMCKMTKDAHCSTAIQLDRYIQRNQTFYFYPSDLNLVKNVAVQLLAEFACKIYAPREEFNESLHRRMAPYSWYFQM